MARQLDGKVALVTGAARGIGKAIAVRLALAGARVVVDDVDDATGEAAVAAINQVGGVARYVHADVSSETEGAALIAATEQGFGPVDILVNNALASAHQLLANEWDPVINVCLKAPWLLMNAVIPGMIQKGTGSIVNISSVNALAGFGQEHVYSAAKAGLIGMSRSMATRYGARGIRINCICPGTIVTDAWAPMVARDPGVHERLVPLYPIGRLGRPDDIAGAA